MRVRGQAWALLLNVPQLKAKNAGVYEVRPGIPGGSRRHRSPCVLGGS